MANVFDRLPSNGAFLSRLPSATPKVVITAETDSEADFDADFLQRWREEGFEVHYIPFGDPETGQIRNGGQRLLDELGKVDGAMSVGSNFGIISLGDAASHLLTALHASTIQLPRLRIVVAYYPSTLPDPARAFPTPLRVQIHIPRSEDNNEIAVSHTTEMLGIQGKRKESTREIPAGKGVGGWLEYKGWRGYVYEDVEVGFAEGDLEEAFDEGATDLAFARDLEVVRGAICGGGGERAEGMERVWEGWWDALLDEQNAEKAMEAMSESAEITYVPTLTGGAGTEELQRFYRDYFLDSVPDSLDIKLLSRTTGADKLVDELLVSFDHTQEMDWILPGMPPTDKHVNIVIVCIVTFRGGRIEKKNVYWDQASVLVQVGLLNPWNIPKELQEDASDRLPVVGGEAAREMRYPGSEGRNGLIEDW